MRFLPALPVSISIFVILILTITNISAKPQDAGEGDVVPGDAAAVDGVNGDTPDESGSDDNLLISENPDGSDTDPNSSPEPEPESEPEQSPITCQVCSGELSNCTPDTTEICELGYSCGQTIIKTAESITYERSCMMSCQDHTYGRCHNMGNTTTCMMCCHEDGCNGVDYDHEAFSGAFDSHNRISLTVLMSVLMAVVFLV